MKRKASTIVDEAKQQAVPRRTPSDEEQPAYDPKVSRDMELGLQKGRPVPIIEAPQGEASEDGIDEGDAPGQCEEPPSSWTRGMLNKEG
jgi:hypothetical protein